jgi:hypothetical protein
MGAEVNRTDGSLHERKPIKEAEGEVERLEGEKAVLTQQIAAPTATTDFATLNRRLQQLQYEIDIATTRWEKATEALEQVLGRDEEE